MEKTKHEFLQKIDEAVWGKEKRGKPRRRKIPKSVKDTVWAKYIGMDKAEGKCYVCKRTIHITDFEVVEVDGFSHHS